MYGSFITKKKYANVQKKQLHIENLSGRELFSDDRLAT